MRRVFIFGSALRGQPDHQNLKSAVLLREAKTKPLSRIHSVENGWHPGIYQVNEGGVSIPGEVYEMTAEQFDYLNSNEPPHMYPTDVILADDEVVTAFFYPQALVEKYGWLDISELGGWVAYKPAIDQPG